MKLYKRPDGRSENWYVRLIIPSALQSAFKSDRFIASTKSSDKVLARARAAAIVEKWERKLYETAMKLREVGQFDGPEPRPTVVNQDLIELLCTSRIGSHLQSDDAERVDGLTEKEAREIDDFVPIGLAAATAVAIRGKGAVQEYAHVRDDANEWAREHGYPYCVFDIRHPRCAAELRRYNTRRYLWHRWKHVSGHEPLACLRKCHSVQASCFAQSELCQRLGQRCPCIRRVRWHLPC